ncbi:mitochondrial 2-oxoglutarate/malate carrier protein-like, partial [Hyposmocoma kahamanoa]|uniref:mitochondrial 2-oxoglutarate/malate carrier protein-like n=1 Tax=Hyposmocoma kahamanoa TaxID=1477025 RepID=UPI000E6D6546
MILMGMCGGVVGSFFGNPAEVALIRMTADGTLPPEKRRNYKNVFNALGRMWKEEGLLSMWRGCSATIVRSAIVNGTQLSTYTQVREMLKPVIGDGPHLYVLAALMSPIATTLVVMPVDNIKTKVQNAKGKANPMKMFTSVIKNEGILVFWHGMIP